MEKQLVYHHNRIGHEINESLRFYADDVFDREIYCRKAHEVKMSLEKDCRKCSYFISCDQGYGIECAWEDITTEIQYTVEHEDRYREYERVDRLIKLGILEKAEDDLLRKVINRPYDKEKWIYEQSKDIANRYLLGTRGEKTLVCCGVNPSFASPENLDPTMKSVRRFAKQLGYDSYIMINLYPMRATDPKKMHETMDVEIVKKNMEFIETVLSKGNCDIWAAWGNLIETRNYLKDCLELIVKMANSYNCKWFTIGERSKAGHPHHPLYLDADSKKEDFDANAYVHTLK